MQIQMHHLITAFITLFQPREVTSTRVFPLAPFYTSKQVRLSRGNKSLCQGKQMSTARRARRTILPAEKGSLGFTN